MWRSLVLKLLFLLFLLHLLSAKRGKKRRKKNKYRTSVCPDNAFCSCYPYKIHRVEVYCFNIESLDPIYELLLTKFNDTVIKRLSLNEDCYLSSLPSYSFENCTIQRFSSSCPFSDIEPHAFMGIKDLTTIDMLNTKFSEVPEGLTNLQYVETLNVTNHSLASLEQMHWNMSSLKSLSFRKGLLEELSNVTFNGMPNLELLDLAHNQLTYIDPEVFGTLKFLEWIALGNNLITSAEDIFKGNNPEVIDLQFNNLTSLNNVIHDRMYRLQTLDISGNSITEISSSTFVGKLEKLKYFFMAHTNCSVLNVSFATHFPRLKTANLGFNNLHDLPKNVFRDHKNLLKIDLKFNSVNCNEVIFHNISRLRTVMLDHNNISSVSDCFGRLLVLESLQLSHNKIQRIDDTDFQGLLQIRTLTLAHNSIEFIGPRSFAKLRYLKTLELSHNSIQQLNGKLRYVTTLEHLLLRSCDLQTLTASDFYRVQEITVLDLSNNELTSVDGAFQNLTKLTSLNLAKNRLTTISRGTFPEKMQLKEIKLERGNEWICDCRLLWLFDWFSDANYTLLKDRPRCEFPRSQHGKIFQEVNTKEIQESQEECPKPCHCECSSKATHSYLTVDCSRTNITQVPTSLPISLGILNLSENNLQTINISSDIEGLFSLNFERNKIVSLEFGFWPRLKELRLSSNMLSRPPMSVLLENSLRTVTLSRNPWICDCDTGIFRDWLLKNRSKVMDLKEVKCSNSGSRRSLSGKVIYLLKDSDLCPKFSMLSVGLAIGFTCCFVLALLLFVCYMYRHHLKSLWYAHGFTSIKEEDNDMDRVFDGFISYNWMDEQFIFSKIIPGLQDVQPNFDLCIPNRDVFGEHSNTIISRQMMSSKRILVLLNQNYVNDENSMMEFRLAHDLCTADKTRRLIFITNGKVPCAEDLGPYIKRALKSSVCISWGERFFWERLRYAMPKKINDLSLRNIRNIQEHARRSENFGNDSSLIHN